MHIPQARERIDECAKPYKRVLVVNSCMKAAYIRILINVSLHGLSIIKVAGIAINEMRNT